ncbi:hypothetical protein D4764_04G0013280 [Takifugu flavidus]|uniref:Uncharacterized protein n=1 Tax=Takifugu flavidus TaxID=433684 RepID=A0A5C6N8R0_9TELE|nr:hypothetical protein D4764_04G0013280 [Takifugu flavidus]
MATCILDNRFGGRSTYARERGEGGGQVEERIGRDYRDTLIVQAAGEERRGEERRGEEAMTQWGDRGLSVPPQPTRVIPKVHAPV